MKIMCASGRLGEMGDRDGKRELRGGGREEEMVPDDACPAGQFKPNFSPHVILRETKRGGELYSTEIHGFPRRVL